MIHMGLLNIIRRMALREKLPIREIARRTGLSRNTIRKYLNAGTIEPRFATPERPSKLDPFAEKLAAKARSLKLGRGTEPGVSVGPLIDEDALDAFEAALAQAVAELP